MNGNPQTTSRPHPTPSGRVAATCMLLTAVLVISVASLAGRWQAVGVPAEAARLRFNPNTATAQELQLLPAIGAVRAARLVAYRRQTDGPAFRTPGDLEQVRGFGPATVAKISGFLTFGPPSAAHERGSKQP